MLRAVIFDFDGLIFDTETPEFQAWAAVYRSHGVELTLPEWLPCIGTANILDPHELLETKTGKSLDRERIRSERHVVIDVMHAQTQPLPGVAEAIASAQEMGLKLGVASSSSHPWVEGWLEKFGLLGHFSSIQCREDVERVKPDPALYLRCLEKLNVRAEEAVALEDSLNGLRAARAAGIFTIVVPNSITRHLPLDEAELLLESLMDLSLGSLLEQHHARKGDPHPSPVPSHDRAAITKK